MTIGDKLQCQVLGQLLGGAMLLGKRALHLGKLNHIAIATRDLKGQLRVFKDLLGAEVSERMVLPKLKVILFLFTLSFNRHNRNTVFTPPLSIFPTLRLSC